MVVRLYGRGLAGELVRKSLPRVDGDPEFGAGYSVLLLEGGPGGGKTAFLKALQAKFDKKLPHAYVNLKVFEREPGDLSVPRLLAEVAFQLAEYCAPYGTLDFRRLGLGHAILRVKLNLSDRQRARRQVRKVLRAHRGVDEVTAVLKEAARSALALTSIPITPSAGLIEKIIDYLVDRLASWRPLRRYLLGPYQEWYGGEEALINLNRWAHNPDAHDRWQIGRLLWRAFLADLDDNFQNGRHSDEWPFNCVVLLDNAHGPVGREFLAKLMQMRWRGHRDPLVIVASGAIGFTTTLNDDQDQPLIHDVQGRSADGAAESAWVRYRLRDLTADDVGAMVRTRNLPELQSRILAEQLYRFTGGHPAVTRRLFDAIPSESTLPARASAGSGVGLATLLAAPGLAPSATERPVEDELPHVLLGPVPEHILDHLATFSAARNGPDGDHLVTCLDPLDPASTALLTDLWRPDPDTEPTLLRRLLLRRLATDPSNWAKIHGVLRAHSASRRDLPSTLYYTLAGGVDDAAGRDDALRQRALEHVSQQLAEQLPGATFLDWLKLTQAVCWAPWRDSSSNNLEVVANELLDRIGAPGRPFGPVAQVVTRLWIAADPLSGSDRGALYWKLAGAFRALPRKFRDETGLPEAIRCYEEKSDLYSGRSR